MNQKDGVFSTVCSVLGQDSFSERVSLTAEQRKEVISSVTDQMVNEEIEMKEESRVKHDSQAKMTKYVNGLVSNWLNKDKRLNGNTKYEAKNPGSRAGSKDPIVVELKKLRKQLTKPEAIAQVDAQIAEQIALSKPTVEINADLIPESLKHLVG